ncbi:TetR/AcrR family transcriptional regulator [Rhodovulum sp. DZ06]|uniref:TetR/AcrR family transcriptional regulator n=1 Tax=Rhodovulum sp. DZ06 TaxID=3425126 RepID=UPI003D339BD8
MQDRRRRTREALLNEARKIVAEDGFDALRTEALAKAAGVAKGTVFAHFGDRDGLALAMTEDSLSRAAEALDRPLPGPGALVEALRPTMSLLTGDAGLWSAIQRVFCTPAPAGEEGCGPLLSWYVALGERIGAAIADMQAAGTARTDQPPALLADGVLAFALHLAQAQHAGLIPHDAARDARMAALLGAWLAAP